MSNDGTSSWFLGPYPSKQDNFRYLKYGVVDSIEDEFGMGRIKVRVNGNHAVGGDGDTLTKDLPWAFPLLPKHLSTIPKVGEVVWIFILGKKSQHADRLYIGPITSQLDKLNADRFSAATPLRPFTFGQLTPGASVLTDETTKKQIPELIGVFPKADEISIQGRYNTDITQKKNEIVIRAGKFEDATTNEFKIAFNFKTQGFIQIINDTRVVTTEETNNLDAAEFDKFFGSMTNIVSNKINLISHNGTPKFNLNQETLLSDSEMLRILDEAHQLPFGDVLLEYLRLLKEAIFSHVHNGNGNPATDLTATDGAAVAALKSQADDLEKRMLSKNIRIN